MHWVMQQQRTLKIPLFVVDGDRLENLIAKTEECMESHLNFLNNQGMVSNIEKTEAIIFGYDKPVEIRIGTRSFKTGKDMKVLSVVFDNKFSWTPQVDNAIKRRRNSTQLCVLYILN